MDKGIEGALRTIDILKKYNITHTGSYKFNEKNNLLIMEIKSKKICILILYIYNELSGNRKII